MVNTSLEAMKIARQKIDQSSKVCLFGIGTLFLECYDQIIGLIGRKPDYLSDNDPQKWGQNYYGHTCIAPETLLEKAPDVLLVITVRNHDAIQIQLSGIGFSRFLYVHYQRNYNVAQAILDAEMEQTNENGSDIGPINLDGKWSMITGASRGIGFLVARELARKGSNIIVHARTLKGLERLGNELAGFPIDVKMINADLGSSEELEQFLKQLEDEYPPVDILYNNAGISPPCKSDFWSVPADHYLEAYRVNTIAPIRICTSLIPGMQDRGFGRIVNLSSSILKRPSEMAYACSKAALDKFVFDLAPSLKNTGVSITLADPGWLRTDMGGPSALLAPESVLPGILIPALINRNTNGQWITVQDYNGLDLSEALRKASRQLSF